MKFLLAPLVAWAIAQAAKVIMTSMRQRRLNLPSKPRLTQKS